MNLTRRDFLASSVAATALAALPARAQTATPAVCVFSKHLGFITDYRALGRTAKELGADALDLTVRKGGHVLPENVTADLPRAVDAIRAEGVDVAMITTNLNSGDDQDARPILEAASKAGVRFARVGGLSYSDDGDITSELQGFQEQLRGLARLLDEYDVTGGYHNHSGGTNMSAALWDLRQVILSIGSERFGSNFDVGHAAVEGAFAGWRINARLLAPYVKMMAVKDFVWDGDRPKWVPLGQGIVKTVEFLKIFRGHGFAGPISLHFEYKTDSNDALLEEMRVATAKLRAYLQEAGYQ